MSDEDLPEWPDGFDTEGPGVIKCSCEFCGRDYFIDTVNIALAHDLPMCPEFRAMEVVDFMRENNRRKMARKPQA